MQYNPKLKIAMEQIKAIVKEHDIAAFVVLSDGVGHSEFLNAISPSFSCAFAEDDGIRIRINQAEIGKEKAIELAEHTYNMMEHFANIIGQHAMIYIEMSDILKKKWNGSSDGGSMTSHTQQNT